MMGSALVEHAVRRKIRKVPTRRTTRRVVSFHKLVKKVADRYGIAAATAWTKATLGYQAQISESALRSALASKNPQAIEAVVGPTKLQTALSKVLVPPLTGAATAAGLASTGILRKHGVEAQVNAVHPNVVRYAREQAAELVAGIPKQTKQIIAEVIARGAERGLTVADQARAIREVVGLPPNWAAAPANLVKELRAGQVAAATGRRMSAALKQQIRSRAAKGTLDNAFIAKVSAEYSASLINRRALTIARTETLRASNFGLSASWQQAQDQGVLPATARRFWIVTPDDRLSPEHARIPGMNPDGRKITEPFFTPDGVFMHPPSRPNCRCSLGLGFEPIGPGIIARVGKGAWTVAKTAAEVEIAARVARAVARKLGKRLGIRRIAPIVPDPRGPLFRVAEPSAVVLPEGVMGIRPATLTSELKGDQGYVYHATSEDRLRDIAESGELKIYKPSFGTDQNRWPDGSVEKRAYFTRNPGSAWQFAPEDGRPVVLRTKDVGLRHEIADDVYTNKPLPVTQLEYLGEDGKWYPLEQLASRQPLARVVMPEPFKPFARLPGDAEILARDVSAYPSASGRVGFMQETETINRFKLPNGTYTPERQELHDAISRKYLEGLTPSKNPTVRMFGGGPASGKSVLVDSGGPLKNTANVDPDDIKKLFPEWGPGRALDAKRRAEGLPGDMEIGSILHEESSELAKRIVRDAIDNKFNIIVQGTGDNSYESLLKKVAGYRAPGYKLTGEYVTVDTETALVRAVARGNEHGRFVPESYTNEIHRNVSDVLPRAITDGLFDEVTLWDTNGKSPVQVLQATGKKVKILDEMAYQRFLAKAQTNEMVAVEKMPFVMGGPKRIQPVELHNYLKAYGQEWKPGPLPQGIKRGKMGNCYENATQLVIRKAELRFAEGIAHTGRTGDIPFLHAWAVTPEGVVIDNTWTDGVRYFGVVYNREEYLAHILKNKFYGVLGGDATAARKAVLSGARGLRLGKKAVAKKAKAPKLRISPALKDRLGPPQGISPVEWMSIKETVEDTLIRIGVKPSVVSYSDTLGSQTVGKFHGTVAGSYDKGKIVLNPHVTPERLAQTAAHEAQHMKFEVALTVDKTLARDILADYADLKEEDGINAYSAAHWDKAGGIDELIRRSPGFSTGETWYRMLPVNETLAEMRALEVATGKVQGTSRYLKLMARVDKAYAKGAKKGMRFGKGKPWARIEEPEFKGFKGYAKGRDAEEAVTGRSSQLTIAQKSAMETYQTESHETINNVLRGLVKVERDSELDDTIKYLDKAIEGSAGASKPVVVWRGINPDWTPEIGTVFVDKGFVSTTTSRKTAEMFAGIRAKGTPASVIRIGVPKGQKGLWMKSDLADPDWTMDSEREFLLPRNSKFRVLRKRVYTPQQYKQTFGPSLEIDVRSGNITVFDVEVAAQKAAKPLARVAVEAPLPGEEALVASRYEGSSRVTTWYRGSEPGFRGPAWSDDPEWNQFFFVAPSRGAASAYGSQIEVIRIQKGAKILRSGTPEYKEIMGEFIGDETNLEYYRRGFKKAERLGWQVVRAPEQPGTVILDRSVLVKVKAKPLARTAKVKTRPIGYPNGPLDLPGRIVQRVPMVTPATKQAVEEVLRAMDVTPKVVRYSTTMGSKTVGDHTGKLLGQYDPKTMKITLNPEISIEQLRATVAHEAQHLKFDVAKRVDKTLEADILADFEGLRRDDGITSYSRGHWQALDAHPGSSWIKAGPGWQPAAWQKQLAVNETLAEIRALEAVGSTVGSLRYRALLTRVDEAYAKGAAKGVKFGTGKGKLVARVEERLEGKAAFEHVSSSQAISKEEVEALAKYSQAGYFELNAGLRAGAQRFDWAGTQELLEQLDSAFARVPPLDKALLVHRGGVLPRSVLKPGAEFTDAGFVSTSSDTSQAATFWTKMLETGPKPPPRTELVRVRVHVPGGSKVIAMESDISAFAKEMELLLDRGGTFRVRSVEKRTLEKNKFARRRGLKQYYKVEVDYIPRGEGERLSRIGKVPTGGVAATPEKREAVAKLLRDMNVAPHVVEFNQQLGTSSMGKRIGDYAKGKIRVDPRMSLYDIEKTVKHEAQHYKFDVAIRADTTLQRDILADYVGLAADDGVTEYSTNHWIASARTARELGFAPERLHWAKILPVNETLAEMRALGITWTPRYQALMKRVEKAYEKGLKKHINWELGYKPRPLLARVEMPKPKRAKPKVGKDALRQIKNPAMSALERKALKEYIIDSADINKWLWQGRFSSMLDPDEKEYVKETIKTLMGVFKRARRLKTDVVVWRGLGKAKLDVGSIVKSKGFMSTSVSKAAAVGFAHRSEVVRILVPKGKRALIGDRGEKELIFPPGSRFRVVRRVKSPDFWIEDIVEVRVL